jgi:hypothetical protein
MSLKSWLLTSSLEDANFFANIRKMARRLHTYRGHRWAEHAASSNISSEVIRIRMCIDCNTKEIMNKNGEWVDRLEKTAKDFYIEDAHSIGLEAIELVQKRLKEFGIELNGVQEDEIYVPLTDTIEKYSNGNYRHEM